MRSLNVLLALPRGFCAGVRRAVSIIDVAIEHANGRQIYVLHEIVHNKHVIERYKQQGVSFVETVEEAPNNCILVLSAHGVSKAVEDAARKNVEFVIDATCPLVEKVHIKAQKFSENGATVFIIGHKQHVEVNGTLGRINGKKGIVIETIEDAESIEVEDPNSLYYVTQTTLSVRDTIGIINVLKRRFPNIAGGGEDDVCCYATQNRQDSTYDMLKAGAKLILVVGSNNSSNSKSLCKIVSVYDPTVNAYLINDYLDINLDWFKNIETVGITAGASAPEDLVEGVVEFLKSKFDVNVTESGEAENVVFKLPYSLESLQS